MKILIYSHSIAPSIDGVCRRMTGIVHELRRQGHEVILVTLEDEPEGIGDVPYHTIRHTFISSYPTKKVGEPSITNLYRIYSIISAERPDLVHVTADGISYLWAISCIMLNIPVISSIHTDLIRILDAVGESIIHKASAVLKEIIESIVFDSVATTSESFRRVLENRYCFSEHVIKTAVNIQTFSPSAFDQSVREHLSFGHPDMFLIVYAGRLSKEKRILELIEITKKLDNSILVMAGDGPLADELSALHGFENKIFCRPQFYDHEELAKIYAACDVHVSCSLFETLGNTVLEAHACGIPVVCPHTQGFCDTITHKKDGFLYEIDESRAKMPDSLEQEEQLALHFLHLLRDDRELRIEMGRQGHEKVQNNSIFCVVGDLLSWYSHGMAKFQAKSWIKRVYSFLSVVWAIGLLLFLWQGYEALNFIYKKGLYVFFQSIVHFFSSISLSLIPSSYGKSKKTDDSFPHQSSKQEQEV